jgi:Cu/Ag efflux protein CusF
MVRIRFDAYPERTFDGRIALISPTLKAETRTVPVRIELANPGQSLKPGMFAQVDLPAASVGAVLTVPNSAVIDSGRRQIVLIDSGEGRFTPREVRLGARDDEQVTVLDGLRAGERVVVAANFLIDAESNLRAALGAFGTPAGTAAAGSPGQASVVHRADGRVDDIDAQAGTLMVAHAPVASLNWPAMTMEFKTANAALLAGLQAGMAIRFEFVERAPGEWVITALSPAKPAAPPGAHAGH